MKYLKKALTPEAVDSLRINLSVHDQKLGPEPVCDFCGDQRPVYVYAAIRMSTGEERECWRWCACAQCSLLVDSQKWEPLKRIIIHRLQRIVPVSTIILRQAVDMALQTFLDDAKEEA